MLTIKILLLFAALVSVAANAGEALPCEKTGPDFTLLTTFFQGSAGELSVRLAPLCRELENPASYALGSKGGLIVESKLEEFASVLEALPPDSKNHFVTRLDQIKGLSGLPARVDAVYQLVSGAIPLLDLHRISHIPQYVTRVRGRRVIGSHVYVNGLAAYCFSKILRKDEAQTELVAGALPLDQGLEGVPGVDHLENAWVRLWLGKSRATAKPVDFDIARYPEGPLPLSSRRSGLPDAQREIEAKECQSYRKCLMATALKVAPQ